ncbi:hypothetical protein [Streptomyces sp. NPDC056061]|uniref:hypothetical protein n=1 Tax=Streptomyces sp. NPDC056061 TaxID=3345700 RepID=UPI0035DC213C
MPTTPTRLPARPLAAATGLLSLAACAPVASGILLFGDLLGVTWSPRAYRTAALAQTAAAVLTSFWLVWTTVARTRRDPMCPSRRRLEQAEAAFYSVIVIAAFFPDGPDTLGTTLFCCALARLAMAVTASHDRPLDLSLGTRTPAERLQTWSITERTVGACIFGAAAASLCMYALRFIKADIAVPMMAGDQLATIGIGGAGDLVLTVLCALAVEDIVIVAAGTSLLTAAGRPAWQIYTVICTVEVALHAYLGLPALGMALYAAARVKLFRAYGRVLPLLVGHAAFDVLGGLTTPLPLLIRLPVLLLVGTAAYRIGTRIRQAAAADTKQHAPHQELT